MPTSTRNLRTLSILGLMMIAGCSPTDERLVEFAERSVETQRQQNQYLAEQSAAVVKESHALATGAQQLVSRDAQARQEMIQSQAKLHEQVHEERVGVDRQREALEEERRSHSPSSPARPDPGSRNSSRRFIARLPGAVGARGLCSEAIKSDAKRYARTG